MIVKLLTEHRLEFLSLKGGCRSSSESTLVKMPHCWKSHVPAHLYMYACVRTISFISTRAYMYRSRFYWANITLISIQEMLRAEYRTSIPWLSAYCKGGVSCMRNKDWSTLGIGKT